MKTRQFYLAHVRPSAGGRHITATVVDPDLSRYDMLDLPVNVRVIEMTPDGDPIVRFPAHMLVRGNNILDLDR